MSYAFTLVDQFHQKRAAEIRYRNQFGDAAAATPQKTMTPFTSAEREGWIKPLVDQAGVSVARYGDGYALEKETHGANVDVLKVRSLKTDETAALIYKVQDENMVAPEYVVQYMDAQGSRKRVACPDLPALLTTLSEKLEERSERIIQHIRAEINAKYAGKAVGAPVAALT